MDLNQVTLEVTDFERSVQFYTRLGLRLIVSARDEYARFELPDGASTLSLHLTDAPVAASAMLYFEVPDIDARYAELKAKGIKFDTDPTDHPWLWREARLRDPSGNRLCLYHAGVNRRFPPWRLEAEA